jgi:hypothetical protein
MLVQHIDEPQDVGGAMPDDSQATDTQAAHTQAEDSAEDVRHGEEAHRAEEQETAATELRHEEDKVAGHFTPAEDAIGSINSDNMIKPSAEEPDEENDLVHQQHEEELRHHQELEQQDKSSMQQTIETDLLQQQHEEELGYHQQQQAEQPQLLSEKPVPLPQEPQAAAEHEEDHDSNYHADQHAAVSKPHTAGSQQPQQQPAVAAMMTATGQAAAAAAAATASAAAAASAHDAEPALLGDKTVAIGAAGVTQTIKGPALHPQPVATAAAGMSEEALMLGSGPPQGTHK